MKLEEAYELLSEYKAAIEKVKKVKEDMQKLMNEEGDYTYQKSFGNFENSFFMARNTLSLLIENMREKEKDLKRFLIRYEIEALKKEIEEMEVLNKGIKFNRDKIEELENELLEI